jgi:UDP-glucose 4-epimerase
VRVLVTGGRGFLGRVLSRELLQRGHEVDVFSRGMQGDIRQGEVVRRVLGEGRYDGIVHLAVPAQGPRSFADPLEFFDVIVGGLRNLLAAVSEMDSRPVLVNASTNAVYGSAHEGKLSEDVPPHPESPYAAAKLAAEQVVDECGVDATTLRIFNIAGGYDTDPTRILPRILAAAADGQSIGVNGDGTAARDFVHVKDVALAVRLALESVNAGGHRTLNVASGVGTSIAELIAAAEVVTGRPIAVRPQPAKPEPHTLVADISRVQADLGWEPLRSSITEIVTDAWNCRRQGR